MAVAIKDFFDHIDNFVEYRRTVYETTEQTLKSNCIDLNLFKGFVTEQGYDTIDGPAAMNFQIYLKKTRKNCGGSINRKLFTLRSYAHVLKLADVPGAASLPFKNVMKIRQGYTNRPHALTLHQIKVFFKNIDRGTILGIRDYTIYALMYLAGLRVGEVHQLDLENIDFDKHEIEVKGKGNKVRSLFLQDELLQVLTEYIAVRSKFINYDNSRALFVSKKGNRLAVRTMEDNIKKIVARTGLNDHFKVTCHTLRHSFASHLNDNDVDILVIQSLMGHASPRSTEPYIHPSFEKIRAAMEQLPTVIYMNKLIANGALKLRFQAHRVQRE